MLLEDVWHFAEDKVFPVQSGTSIFNAYRDQAADLDVTGAAAIRRCNLRRWLESFSERPRLLVLGKAASSTGFRFSGVPFVSEAQLVLPGSSFSVTPTSRRSAMGKPYGSGHDTRFWNVMQTYAGSGYPRFLPWNCVPFYLPGETTLKAREVSDSELARYAQLAAELYEVLRPEIVVALGEPTQRALRTVRVPHRPVHAVRPDPRNEFDKGMARVMLPLLARGLR